MSCITQLLEMKGNKEILPIHEEVVMEGGGLYKDHEYLIVFTSSGHRCGYVALHHDESEKFNNERDGEAYYLPDLDCHGGVTFYEKEHSAKNLLPIPCDDFWIGFDAAHYRDLEDMETAEKYFGLTRFVRFKKENPSPNFSPILTSSHKSYAYMEDSCKHIIDQLV